jgi:hypothetical protein
MLNLHLNKFAHPKNALAWIASENNVKNKGYIHKKTNFMSRDNQGCQMVCFQTKNTNLGKFWWALQ